MSMPVASESVPLLQAQAAEIAHLRGLVNDMMQVTELQREDQRSLADFARLVPQMREANEHLVQATFGAFNLRAAAEEVNRKQLEFMSILAHELRSPLQPVVLANRMLGLLADCHPDLPKLHSVIARQVEHMSRLIEDLLDAGRLSSGKFALDSRPVLLSAVLESALETCAPMMDQRRQELHLHALADVAVVNGDRVRLTQAFANLLINASKFTPDGGHLSLRVQRSALYVSVLIKDTGIGIDAALQPHIFELFTQGYRPPELSRGGLGIGLALVRTIAEMHGGTVSVYSAGLGQGSEFMLSLPLAEALPATSGQN